MIVGESYEFRSLRSYRLSLIACYLMIILIILRKLIFHLGAPELPLVIALLGSILLLFSLQPWISKRFGRYRWVSYLIQICLVTSLGWIGPDDDIWVFFYIPIGVQMLYDLPRRAIMNLAILAGLASLLTMILKFGLPPGIGYGLLDLTIVALIVSYGWLYAQTEANRIKSQALLAELQEAYQQLAIYTAKAKELSAEQERNRLARELHDSVSQTIFSISLTTQSARMLLEKDPQRLPEQLNQLEGLTSQALARMRALISQWRPK